MWDAFTGAPLTAVCPERTGLPVGFSADGSRFVTAAYRTARVWDAHSGGPVGWPLTYGRNITAVALSPDGGRVVTATEDNAAQLWNVSTGALMARPMRHGGAIYSVAFSPAGTRVLTASYDMTARLWDAENGKPIGHPMLHTTRVASAIFSPDGKRILTVADGSFARSVSEDFAARLWDADSTSLLLTLHHQRAVASAAFSADGGRVVTGSLNNSPLINLIMRGTDKRLTAEKWPHVAELMGDSTAEARVWDARTGQPIGEPMRHLYDVGLVSFSPDGARVLTGSGDGTARQWDAATGRPLGPPMKHDRYLTATTFSPDGTRILTVAGKTARLWNARSGEPQGAPMVFDNFVLFAVFSPDGKQVVTSCSPHFEPINIPVSDRLDAERGRRHGQPGQPSRATTSCAGPTPGSPSVLLVTVPRTSTGAGTVLRSPGAVMATVGGRRWAAGR
jgi:WD40 repeat protein